MKLTEFEVDLRVISHDEAREYIHSLRGRERLNRRRIQAWFDHCARIRSHPSSQWWSDSRAEIHS